jgi:sRNA-binding protein
MTQITLRQFCAEAGIVCPTKSTLISLWSEVKDNVLAISKEQLLENLRKHNRACRQLQNYKGDIEFVDINGRKHSVAQGPIAIDGAGGQHAYSHRIKGMQHALVIFLLLTAEPIFVQCDQISCQRCSILHLKLMFESKNFTNMGNFDLRHEGRCYRNSVHGPATAEEYACIDAANLLLIDPDTNELLGDDLAIFGDEIVTDGDTRGATKFIDAQAHLIGEPAYGLAARVPDIGHFVKTVSNALYNIRREDSTLRGKGLLDPPRIKAIAADLSREIRRYGKFLKEKGLDLSPEQQGCARQRCLDAISAIIPHHCGDHSQCTHDGTCTFKLVELQERSANEATGRKRSEAEIAKRVSERFCGESRFKGKYMSMDHEGKEMCMLAIQSRVDKQNIDRLARILSTNVCECYFNVLVKFSHGKRLNLGQTNSWEVLLHFVAGLMSHSNVDVSTRTLHSLNLKENEIRIAERNKLERQQKADKARKETEVNKRKRIVSDFARKQRTAKDSTKKERHMPDKVSFVNGGEAQHCKPKTFRCANCDGPHKSGTCVEATYAKRPQKKKQKMSVMTVDEIHSLF